MKCGEIEYELVDNGGYLTLISVKCTISQSIAVIHPSGMVSMLSTGNNEIDVKYIIDSKRRIRGY